MTTPVNEIVVCMGSACFSRGNTSTILAVQQYLKSRGLEDQIEATGTLCQNKCREGPNIFVNGKCLCGVEPTTIPTLLDEHLGMTKS